METGFASISNRIQEMEESIEDTVQETEILFKENVISQKFLT